MMSKTIHIALFLLLAMAVSGCKYHCPGYDLSDHSLIDARLGDTLSYTDGQGDTIRFVVKNFYNGGPFEVEAPPMACVDCGYDVSYSTDTVNGIYLYVKLEHTFIHRFNENSEYDDIDNKTYSHEHSDTVVDGKSFTKFIYTDLTGKRRISRFAKAFYRDIYEFYDSKTGKTWRRIN